MVRRRAVTDGLAARHRRRDLQLYFGPTSFLYNVVYFLLVVIFTFFYSSIVVNTKDIADNLKKIGLVHPRHPSGPADVEYINKILFRITTAAAVYLGLLAVLPSLQQNTRHHDALHRFDLAADRRRRRARFDHPDRSAPGDARLPRFHQEMIVYSSDHRGPARARRPNSRGPFRVRQISTGDMLRRHRAEKTALGPRGAELHGLR